MRVLVTGGRWYGEPFKVVRNGWRVRHVPRPGWENELAVVWRALDALRAELGPFELVVGDAKGADRMAREWASTRNVPYETHVADWGAFDRGAGPLRNQAMVDSVVDMCIAFPGGEGTSDCKTKARVAGVPVREIS